MHNLEQRLVYMLHFPFGLEALAADLHAVKTAEMPLSDSAFEQGAPNAKLEPLPGLHVFSCPVEVTWRPGSCTQAFSSFTASLTKAPRISAETRSIWGQDFKGRGLCLCTQYLNAHLLHA